MMRGCKRALALGLTGILTLSVPFGAMAAIEKPEKMDDATWARLQDNVLEYDEISDLVETSQGYHIIKCISTFNREETDANKVKIVEKRRREVFGEEYEAFVESLTRDLNEELWQQVSFLPGSGDGVMDFFDVYDRYVSLNLDVTAS